MRLFSRLTNSFYYNRQTVLSLRNQHEIITSKTQIRENHHESNSRVRDQRQSSFSKWAAIITFAGAGGILTLAWTNRDYVVDAFTITKTNKKNASERDAIGQTIYTRQDVARHNSISKGVWITFKGKVYDVTEFVKHHPGGSETIMMGAGGDVEPFWKTYTVHHAVEVQNVLSQYQIGTLDPAELTKEQEVKTKSDEMDEDPYATDPSRSSLLQVLSEKPFNAETPSKLLTPTYLTPTEIFFVRNHLPVPEVDPDEYRLAICLGSDGNQDNLKVLAEFTLHDLKTKYKPHSLDCVIQCSGNRRSDLKLIREIKGLNWKVGAIGNARWTGVRLIDLLESLGIRDENYGNQNIKHIQLEGLDCDMSGQSYGASISSDLVFDKNKNVLLAYEMNGQPLTRDHGFPLRLVAPGVTGARNVKWLGKVVLSSEESHSHWQRKDYKSFSPNVDMFNLNFDESVSIQETPVQSAICDPQDGQELDIKVSETKNSVEMSIPVKGYAFSGGGKMIIRVDVSVDGGQNWFTAKLEDIPRLDDGLADYTARNHTYSWTRWSLNVPISDEMLDKKSGNIEIICRAFDSSYNSQPERPETIWNVRGVVNNSWHRIKLKLNVQQ